MDVPDGGKAWRCRTVVVCRLQRIERGTKTLNQLLEAFGKIVGVETVRRPVVRFGQRCFGVEERGWSDEGLTQARTPLRLRPSRVP